MRAIAHVVVLVLISAVSVSLGMEMESLELVQEFQDPAQGTMQVSYSEIPGFVLKEGSTSVPGKDKDGCAAICSGEQTCKSFSYDAKDEVCLWSVDALNFDPAWHMKTKAHHSAEPTKLWRDFPGLVYRADGWVKATGKTMKECEALCKEAATCEAMNYREEDMLCLMSPKAVHYSSDFTYYEKEGLAMQVMPITHQGGATMPSQEPAKADESAKENTKEEVAALMNAETNKLDGAEQEIAEASNIEAESKQAVQNEKNEMHTEIEQAKKEAEADLQKQEADFASAQAQKMTEEESTLKLQFASAELKEKASVEQSEASSEKERTEKSAADVKAHAAREAARAVAEGAEEAAQRVETAQLDEKQLQAQAEINDAEEKSQKAALQKQNAVDEVEATKEVAEKKTAAADKEIAEKKALLEGKTEEEKAAGMKLIQEAEEKATAAAQQRTIEIEAKVSQRTAERAEKAKAAVDTDERNNKGQVAQAFEETKAAEEAKQAADARLTQMEKQTMLAKVEAEKLEAQSAVAAQEQQLRQQQAINAAQLEAKKNELSEQIRAKMESEAAAEVEQQREEVARDAARRVAEASKAEADRIAQEANDAVKRSEIQEKTRVANVRQEILSEERVQEQALQSERQRQQERILAKKEEGDERVAKIEQQGKEQAKAIEDTAAANAKAKMDKAEADARLTEAKGKEMGEKHAADISAAAAQASLIFTMTIKADVATYVSSGLNPGSQSYNQLETSAKAAAETATQEQERANQAKQAADAAAAQVATQEARAKELAQKSTVAENAASATAGQNAEATTNEAVAKSVGTNVIGGGRKLLSTSDLDKRLRSARHRAVGTMRRLLQSTPVENSASELTTKATSAAALAVGQQVTSESSTKSNAQSAAAAASAQNVAVQAAADAQASELNAKSVEAQANSAAAQAQAAAEAQQAALVAANLLPANTAYGKLPEMFDHRGYLKVQSGGPLEQSAFLKFSVSALKSTDTVVAASMRLYKTGGGSGPAVIKLSSCAWTRNTLTYTSSENLPEATVSEGVTASFPEESNMWAAIKLKPSLIQSARANGDHICFEVSGGPKDDAVIISSELSSDQPELKMEVQSAPKTEEERAAEVAKQAAEAQKLQAENDMEQHLKQKYTNEVKAAVLGDKAAALATTLANINREYADKQRAETEGDAFAAMQLQNTNARVAEENTLKRDKTQEITDEENSKVSKTLTDSGLVGDARTALENQLNSQKSIDIARRVADMEATVTGQMNTKYLTLLTDEIESKKAALATELANRIAAETAAASQLSDAELTSIQGQAEAKTAAGMADWKVGKLVDPTAPASAQEAAAEEAQAQLSEGNTQEDRAQMEQRIADDVQQKLPAALNTAVNGKMAEAEANAINGVKSKLEADAAATLAADIARETAGKNNAEAAPIRERLTATSQVNTQAAITAATTSSALNAMKAKLMADLTEEVRPGIVADLKAQATKLELAKMQADVAARTNEQVAAVTGALGTELGQESPLDNAKMYKKTGSASR